MILRRFYDDKLAQASYLVGCAATGEALVVDPPRDVEPLLAAAAAEHLRITHVTETHIHADFVSGAREIAARTGAQLYLSDEGGDAWKYEYAQADGAVLLKHGDTFRVGNVRIDVVHTPGHTPEHLSFIVTDTASADAPMGVFTGDFVFVGDVGRPDLLERAANQAGTMEAGARTLFGSLAAFSESLPEFVQLWPGHGAGSACGKSLGAVPQTTLGYEKLFNWGLAAQSEDEFVEGVLAGQPEPPMYFAEMKRINRAGPRVLHGLRTPERVPDERVVDLVDAGALLVDLRPAAAFAARHIPGAVNVPPGRSFTTWAGSVLPYDRDFYLIADATDDAALDTAVRDLAMIGLDRVSGWLATTALDAWSAAGRDTGTVPDVTPDALVQMMENGAAALIDVRNGSEWQAGHIAGSRNVPLGRLAGSIEDIPRDRPVVVHCQAGGRASVAISVLRAHGFTDVRHLAGDFGAWSAQRRPIVSPDRLSPWALRTDA